MESIKIRYNVMQIHSITGFANIRGGFVRDCKDVYFVRGIGCDKEYLNEIEKMDEMGRSVEEQKGGYLRLNKLPQLCRREDIDYYTSCYEQYKKGETVDLRVKETGTDALWDSQLLWACNKVSHMFQEGMTSGNSGHASFASESMVKNFIMKILYQTDQVADELFGCWDIHKTYKFTYNGSVKKHEYLFCYFLTLLGIDVLLLLPQGDVSLPKLWMDLSFCAVLGNEKIVEIPSFKAKATLEPIPIQRPVISAAANYKTEQSIEQMPTTNTVNEGTQVLNGNNSVDTVHTGRQELSFEELAALASSIVMIASHDKRGNVTGTGSGIMVGEDGYILTNNHVIAGGAYFSVRMEEEEQIYQTDEIIKYHALFDLALLRIERKLKPLPIYQESKKLVRGQKVVAIGSPLGLFNSVSDGIISGFRHFQDVDMMQFTAPISHGSSGGAVLNMYGELIGISTAGMDDGQNLNLAVDYNYILQFGRGIYS